MCLKVCQAHERHFWTFERQDPNKPSENTLAIRGRLKGDQSVKLSRCNICSLVFFNCMSLLLTPQQEDLHPLRATHNTRLFVLLNVYHSWHWDCIEIVPHLKRFPPSSKNLVPPHLLLGGWDLPEMEVSLHFWCLQGPISPHLPWPGTAS